MRIDWRAHHGGDPRWKIPLPQYPFEPREYWIGRAKVPRVAGGDEGDAGLFVAGGGAKEAPQRSKIPAATPAIDAILRAPIGDRRELVLAWLQSALQVLNGTQDPQGIPAQASLEEAGIDSLASIRLHALIEDELKLRVAVKTILSTGTVSGLAALLSDTIGAAGKQQENHDG